MMKLSSTLNVNNTLVSCLLVAACIFSSHSNAQLGYLTCTNPTNMIYGLSGGGEIREINVANGATATLVKNNSYGITGPKNSNGLGYNIINRKFYYFKRNVTETTPQFVSFDPLLGIVTTLANSTCTNDVHTGCVNFLGTGYYTVDNDGNLSYYNILGNSWKMITSKMVDQYGMDVDSVIRQQTAGDMAIDGYGAIWLVTSNDDHYALYKINALTSSVASLTVTRVVAPTSNTPTGESFAGIAFSPGGQIYMSTKSSNRFYRLNNNFTLTFLGTLGSSDIGNDLTSCNFPALVLPVSWKSFDATAESNNEVNLSWEVVEQNNHGFYVQHSLDGTTWQDLTFISSKAVGEEVLEKYSFTHANHFTGTQYYRIKQVNNDNKVSYSEVKTVVLKNSNQLISIWPNPAKDQVKIVSQAGGSNGVNKAQIFDLSGRMIAAKQLQSNTINTMDISSFPVGTYIIRVEGNNGISYNQKISKQ